MTCAGMASGLVSSSGQFNALAKGPADRASGKFAPVHRIAHSDPEKYALLASTAVR